MAGSQAAGHAEEGRDGQGPEIAGTGAVGFFHTAAARRAQEGDAVSLGIGGGGQTGDQAQHHQRHEQAQLLFHAGQAGAVQQGKGQHELTGKAVEGREAGDGDRADAEGRAHQGHALLQAAQQFHAHGAGGVQHFTGGEEEQALESRVVEHVEHGTGQTQSADPAVAAVAADEPGAHAHEHEAHVLHAGVGQQALEVALGQSLEDAHQRRAQPQEQGQPAPPGRGGAEGGHEFAAADDAVQTGVDHGAGEQGRDVAGRGRVGLGQPDVHGRDAGLGAEAQQGQHEQDRGQRRHGAFLEGQGSKGRIARVLPEQAEEGQQQHGTQVGGHQIDPRSVAHVAVAVVEVDEEEGRQGHDFPGQQEEHGVTGHHDHGHAQHQQQIEEPVGGQVMFAGAGMAQRDAPGTGTDEAQAEDRQQEDAGKGVQPQTQTAHGQAPGLGPQ